MKAQLINPFLESAQMVIEQVVQISPRRGELSIKEVEFHDQHIWIKIGMTGNLNGDIVFGIHEQSALKIISAMMGGMEIHEIDELGKSAISELCNMITGNTSTLFYNQGVSVDITPPMLVEHSDRHMFRNAKALIVPLKIGDIGEFKIQVLIGT